MIEQLDPWITAVILIALFVWLWADMRDMRSNLSSRLDGLDARLRAVETGFADVKGELTIVRDYIAGRNVRGQKPTEDARTSECPAVRPGRIVAAARSAMVSRVMNILTKPP